MRLHLNKRRGQVVPLIAVSLIAILGFVALVLEGGLLLNQRRHAQVAADAAALAAAARLYDFMTVEGGGYDSEKGGEAAAFRAATTTGQEYAKANGYEHIDDEDEGTVKVEVNIPPKSGPGSVGTPPPLGYAEVIITTPQPRRFSSIFGRDDFVVKARAVARVGRGPIPYAIVVLNPTDKSAFSATGQGSVIVTGAGVMVDSNHNAGGVVSGGGIAKAPHFDFAGTPGHSGNFQIDPAGGSISGGQPVVPDPLAWMRIPTSPGLPGYDPLDPIRYAVTEPKLTVVSKKKMTISGDTMVTLEPGIYRGGISITTRGTVTLKSGIYYMDGGGFSMTGQGSLIGEEGGIMIYNAATKNSDNIVIAGQGVAGEPGGEVKLKPLSVTNPNYANWPGILLFQDRTSKADVMITGNGKYNISGTFYAAKANLKVAGQGDAQIGSQYVSDKLTSTGGGKLQINWKADTTGKTLYFGLVE